MTDLKQRAEELVGRLREWDHCWPAPWLERAVVEAADLIAALAAENERLVAERDEARRRRDMWKARADNHVEIVNALRAKTSGQDSRTLSRALLGAAFSEAEARAEALATENKLLREYYEARQAFEAERTTGNGMRVVRARAALTEKENGDD